jgi:outer membrane protein OmpA-like peptidoglycan-associated protein
MIARPRAAVYLAAAFLIASPAVAQDSPSSNGYDADIDLIRPTYNTDVLPGFDVPENERPGTVRWGIVGQYLKNPLVLYQFDEQVGPVVSNRATAWLGASVDITRAVSVRATVPLSGQWGSQVPRYAADGFAVGDASVGFHAALLRKPVVGFGVYGDIVLPSSRHDFYNGERNPRIQAGVSLLANAGHFRWVTNLGVNVRTRSLATTEDWTLGQELIFNNGFRYDILPEQLTVGLTTYGRFGFSNFFGAAESSGEALVNLRYQFPAIGQFVIGLTGSGGRGFTKGYGSSDARIMVGLDFARLPPLKEEDPGFVDNPNGAATDPGLQFNVRNIGQIKAEGEGEITEPEWDEGILAKVDEKTDRIVIRDAIRFKVNSAELLEESYPTLDFLADLLNHDARILHVVVEGHASEDGEYGENYELSEERAASIWQRLIMKGVVPSRVSIRGMGEVQPLGADEKYDALQASRRVIFHITGQLQSWEDPPVYNLDLKYPWNGEPYKAIQPTMPTVDDGLGEDPKTRPEKKDDDLKDLKFEEKSDDDAEEPKEETP